MQSLAGNAEYILWQRSDLFHQVPRKGMIPTWEQNPLIETEEDYAR